MKRFIVFNPVVRCQHCGHLIPQGEQDCPYCNRVVPKLAPTPIPTSLPTLHINWKRIVLIAALIIGILIALFLVVSLLKNCSKPSYEERSTTAASNSPSVDITKASDGNPVQIPDGDYCYEGYWKSQKYEAQACRMEFTKQGNRLYNCTYTNLRYSTTIPLIGTIQNDELHFVGNINGKDLVIDLKPSNVDATQMKGTGTDYAHSEDKATLEFSSASAVSSSQQPQQAGTERVDLSMHGTISTISNVSFVMNGTRGVLEYVMDGNSVVSELHLGALRPDGTLTVKSYTPEGKQKGTFNGKLTTTNGSKQYKGQFTNVKGGSTTFSFTE